MTWNSRVLAAERRLFPPHLQGPWRCAKCTGTGGILWLALHKHEEPR